MTEGATPSKDIEEIVEHMMTGEQHRQMAVIKSGYRYDLFNMGNGCQPLQFIEKEPSGHTLVEGTTNEAVLQALIHRISVLNEKMPSPYNEECLTLLTTALKALYRRTAERQVRGVEGTMKP